MVDGQRYAGSCALWPTNQRPPCSVSDIDSLGWLFWPQSTFSSAVVMVSPWTDAITATWPSCHPCGPAGQGLPCASTAPQTKTSPGTGLTLPPLANAEKSAG